MAVSTASYIAQRSEKDVRTVETEAQHLLRLTPTGVEYRFHEFGKLPVIAVVGPGFDCQVHPGCTVPQAVLCEVGLKRATPYAQSQFDYKRDRLPFYKSIRIPRRAKLFCLSKQQYVVLAPHLLRLMQRLTNEQVNLRVHGGPSDPFYRNTTRLYIRRAKGEVIDQVQKKPFVRGIRFHIDLRDQLLIADLCRAALYYNVQATHERSGLRKFICRGLEKRSARHSFSRFSKLKYVAVALEAMQRPSLARHDLVEVLESLRKHPHFEHLAQAAGYEGQLTPVHALANQALKGLRRRLQLVTEMTPQHKDGEHLYRLQLSIVVLNGHLNIEFHPNQEAWDLLEQPSLDPDQLMLDEFWLESALELQELGFDECPF